MIQRIQTVFFLLVLVCLGLYLWFPLIAMVEGTKTNTHPGWEVHEFYKGYLYFINAILAGTAGGFALISIFLFKNRKLQMLFTWFSILFWVCSLCYVFYRYQTWECRYDEFLTHKVIECNVKLTFWNLAGLAAIIFNLAAFYFIRKDEDLVKSLDRLR